MPEKERYLAIASYYQTGPGFDRAEGRRGVCSRRLSVDTGDMTASVNLANNLRSRRDLARAESIYRAINTSSRVSQLSMGNHAGMLMSESKVDRSRVAL